MANLAAIKGEVKRIVEERITSLDAAITTHIQRAQRSIEDRCAFDIQESQVTYQYLTSGQTMFYPSNYIAIRGVPHYRKTSTDDQYTFLTERLEFDSLGIRFEVASGSPVYWRHNVGLAFEIWPPPDHEGPSPFTGGAYDVVFPYCKKLSSLVEDADTNWWSENMDDVLGWKAAANVFAELRDPLAQFWNSVAFARFFEILKLNNRNKIKSFDQGIFPRQSLSANTKLRFGRKIVTRVP